MSEIVLRKFLEWHAEHFGDFSAEVNAELLCLANDAEAALGFQPFHGPSTTTAPPPPPHECSAAKTIEYAITLLEVNGGNPRVIEYLRAGLDQHDSHSPESAA